MKPNILYYVADQMRADAQHYLGNEASITPHLDALAKESVAFRNAYCQNPVCVPSRCSFLTGLYPHTTGHRTIHYLQNQDEPNILRVMKNAGYEVIWIGRNDVVPGNRVKSEYCDAYFDGIHDGDTKDMTSAMLSNTTHFNRVAWNDDLYSFYFGKVDGYGQVDVNCVDACIQYLEKKRKDGNEKPFFIYCTLTFPHPPYAVDDPWYSKIDRTKLPQRKPWCPDKPRMLVETANLQNLHHWDETRWDDLRATYLAMVSKWDDGLGRVVESLKRNAYYDDTNIFVFSDHGDYTGDYDIVEKLQNCFEDDLTNIPLVIKPSKHISVKPRITNALAELVDLSATIADMTDTDLGYVQYGKSLVHVLTGDDEHKDAVFCEGGRPFGDRPAMELGHDDPHDMYWPRLHVQQCENGQHTRTTMIRMGNLKYVLRHDEKDELYDLEKDPNELVNEIDNPSYQIEIQRMKLRMLDWYQETADWVPNRKDQR